MDHYPRLARLQLPLAVLIGKSIKFGTVGHEKRRRTRDPRFYPGVVWGLHRLGVPLLVTKSGYFFHAGISVSDLGNTNAVSAIILRWAAFGFQLEHFRASRP